VNPKLFSHHKKPFSQETAQNKEIFMGDPVLIKLFVRFITPVPSSAEVEMFFSPGKDIFRIKRG
jgi:hypothetical protein